MKTVFISVFSALSFAANIAFTQPPEAGVVTLTNLSYYSAQALRNADGYQKSQCQLDLRYPANRSGFATVVWFHGGGLTGGKRHFINLKDPEIAVAAVGYRLSPKAPHPAYLEDAAAAVAWVIRNVAQYGGDSNKVFVAGHSAGGYLTAMVGMDPRWLAAHDLSIHQLAGLIPVSAQVTTHFQVKKLLGDTGQQYRPLIDEYAPLYYCSSNLPPICLVLGDRKIEFKCRVEENDLMAVSLRTLGHPSVEFHELAGLNHGTVGTGAMPYAQQFIKKYAAAQTP
ncbi:MAG TPA: alpha/beta hydrolase [Kiritimatiellia bacterium]|nr:alpha/beta hydrolase [Kiritimatiellia bacterium]HPS07277.1 alpha/beta hydrolase [Kiritimatiellia bacterium]